MPVTQRNGRPRSNDDAMKAASNEDVSTSAATYAAPDDSLDRIALPEDPYPGSERSPAGSPTARERASGQGSRIERIAQRAYEIYEARGGEHGRSVDDWLSAEREVDGAEDEGDSARG